MSHVTFVHPQLLWLLLPASALWLLLVWLDRRHAEALSRFLSTRMQHRLASRLPPSRRVLRLLGVLVMLVSGTLALSRPQSPGELETVRTTQISADVMVVLDVSRSMLAEDAAPNRLQRAKAEISDLLSKLKGHRIGLVAFAGRAQVLCPLTPDYGFFRMVLDRADPRSIGRGGTRIGDGLRLAKSAFGEGSSARLVLLITDGEDHDSFPLEAAQELKKDGIRVVAIGFGDERGSEITLTDPNTGARTFLVDRGGQLVRSRLDGKTLREIALATQGAYIPAGVAALDLESILREHIQPLVRSQPQTATRTQPKEHHPWLLWVCLLALVASVRLGIGARRALRWDGLADEKRLVPATILVWLLGLFASAHASPAALTSGALPTRALGSAAAATGGSGAADSVDGGTASAAPPAVETGSPRRRYNQAREAWKSGNWARAEAGFLAARDHAEGDEDLRFRAAFNLALTHAQRAATQAQDKPQDALNELSQSAAWFRDAVRIRPSDGDARHNLEVVLRRMQELREKLNHGQSSLEARLARIIADERTLRDRVRGLLVRIQQAGSTAEPLSFHSEFEDASNFQRTLLSEAGAIVDLAGDERDKLSQRAEKDRSAEDQGRLIQLQNLEHYMNLSRGTLADVARLLRRLQGERAHRQSDVGVDQLKRAMEQLQDPVTVLKGLVADQMNALGQTRALDEARAQSAQLAIAPSPATAKTAPSALSPASPNTKAAAHVPAWLTASFLGDQQRALMPRGEELLARLNAGVEHEAKAAQNPSSATQPAPGQPPGDPRQEAQRKRVLQAAREAIPLLKEGIQAMDQAATSLAADQLPAATKAQLQALASLLRAVERFSGLRDLIELAFGDQSQLAQLLSGKAKAELERLPPAERSRLFTESVARNRDRLARLQGLFSDELQALAAPPPSPQQGSPPSAEKDEAEKRAAEKQRFEQAEQKRKLAEDSLLRLAAQMAQKNAQLLPTVEEGRKHLEDLRRLFFSIVEHLKDLHRNQTETLDHTGSAQAQKEEAERRRRAGPLFGEQERHRDLGRALAEALAAQADQAGSASEPQAKQAQKPLADAAEEVRKAHTAMEKAGQLLKPDEATQSDAHAQSLPLDLEPAMEQQKQVLAHVEAAIRILEPPQKDQQKQEQKNPQQEQEQLSQDQAARRLQAIREREAERQRKQKQPAGPSDPVEKDW